MLDITKRKERIPSEHLWHAKLKELKKCRTALKIIRKKEMIKPVTKLEWVYKETEELVAIIGKSISTAKKKTGWLNINF